VAEKTETPFTLSYSVRTHIQAAPAAIWKRLTDAASFSRWNSTVESIEGQIAVGNKLKIRVPAAPGRVFTPKVVALVPEQSMTWRDGLAPMFVGTRSFELMAADGGTEFRMTEAFRGLMLPMIKGSLPDFSPIFDRYAADLKQACEALPA
jgi:hypothetical protein